MQEPAATSSCKIEALDYINQILALRIRKRETGGNEAFAQTYCNLSSAFSDVGETDKALQTAKKAQCVFDALKVKDEKLAAKIACRLDNA